MSSGSGLDLDLHTTKVTPIFESNEFDGESILHQLGGGSSATMINLPLHQGMLMDDNSSQALLSQSTPHGAHQVCTECVLPHYGMICCDIELES